MSAFTETIASSSTPVQAVSPVASPAPVAEAARSESTSRSRSRVGRFIREEILGTKMLDVMGPRSGSHSRSRSSTPAGDKGKTAEDRSESRQGRTERIVRGDGGATILASLGSSRSRSRAPEAAATGETPARRESSLSRAKAFVSEHIVHGHDNMVSAFPGARD